MAVCHTNPICAKYAKPLEASDRWTIAESQSPRIPGRFSPIFHQKASRIEAHIFIAFVAYCVQITLKQRLRALAPGLTL